MQPCLPHINKIFRCSQSCERGHSSRNFNWNKGLDFISHRFEKEHDEYCTVRRIEQHGSRCAPNITVSLTKQKSTPITDRTEWYNETNGSGETATAAANRWAEEISTCKNHGHPRSHKKLRKALQPNQRDDRSQQSQWAQRFRWYLSSDGQRTCDLFNIEQCHQFEAVSSVDFQIRLPLAPLSFHWIAFRCRFIRYFDVCIIDEASQCTEPWSLVPLQYQIKSLILVGDTNQLSPVVLSSVGQLLMFLVTCLFSAQIVCIHLLWFRRQVCREMNFERSLFARLFDTMQNGDVYDGKNTYAMTMQYRMHPDICAFSNTWVCNVFIIYAMYIWRTVLPYYSDTSIRGYNPLRKPHAVISLYTHTVWSIWIPFNRIRIWSTITTAMKPNSFVPCSKWWLSMPNQKTIRMAS